MKNINWGIMASSPQRVVIIQVIWVEVNSLPHVPPSKVKPLPGGFLLRCIEQAGSDRRGEVGRRALGAEKRDPSAEKSARRADQPQLGFGTIACLQVGAHVADRIRKAQFARLFADPEQAGKKIVIVGEPGSAPSFYQIDEDRVDLLLKLLE